MANDNLSVPSATPDAAGLETALFGSSDAPKTDAPKPEVQKPEEGKKTAGKPAAEEKDGGKDDEEEPEGASDEEEGEDSEATEDEGSEETAEDESGSENDDDDGDSEETYQLGGRTFATAQDAVKEAQRIVGRNAILAGEVRDRDTKISELTTKLEEAITLNHQWKEWADAREEGKETETPENRVDPNKIADEAVKRVRAETERDRVRTQYKEEIETVMALGNYEAIYPVLVALSDKVNPLTGKNFTPYEAYDYACNAKGIENMRTSEGKKTAKAVPVPPKKVSRTTVKSAAARPNGSRSGTVPPSRKSEPSFAEEMLSQQLSI